MSLNKSHAGNGGVVLFTNERILIYYDGVELKFDNGSPTFLGTKKGRIYLTTHRMIFISTKHSDPLQSFSCPFLQLRDCDVGQPIFGANYVKGKFIAEQLGGWQGESRFKLIFTHGGAIDFGRTLLEAARLASRNRSSFVSPTSSYDFPPSSYQQAVRYYYEKPRDNLYSFVPYSVFPSAPPANSVYLVDAPPPYPGVVPDVPVAPYAATSKEAEAMASAPTTGYYPPNNAHTAFLPPNHAPPSYDSVGKKNN